MFRTSNLYLLGRLPPLMSRHQRKALVVGHLDPAAPLETKCGLQRNSTMEVCAVPVAIIIIVGIVLIAVALIGLVWSVLVLVPFYTFIGVALFLVWRSRRKQAEIAATVEREAERQRLFNEQEMRAWQASLQKQQRIAAKREKMLRRFDSARDPPEKP